MTHLPLEVVQHNLFVIQNDDIAFIDISCRATHAYTRSYEQVYAQVYTHTLATTQTQLCGLARTHEPKHP